MFSRKQYMAGECTYREYYSQFAHIFKRAVRLFGTERLKTALAEDEHLNNIPLHKWDVLSRMYQHEIAHVNHKIGNGRVWALSDGVCAAKEAAKQICEETENKKETDNV